MPRSAGHSTMPRRGCCRASATCRWPCCGPTFTTASPPAADPMIWRLCMGHEAAVDRFSDPEAVSRYAEGPPRLVPGFADLQRMTTILLAERAPADARV